MNDEQTNTTSQNAEPKRHDGEGADAQELRPPRPFAEVMGAGPGGPLFTELCNLTEGYFSAKEADPGTMAHEIACVLYELVYAVKGTEVPGDLRAMLIHRVAKSAGRDAAMAAGCEVAS